MDKDYCLQKSYSAEESEERIRKRRKTLFDWDVQQRRLMQWQKDGEYVFDVLNSMEMSFAEWRDATKVFQTQP